MLASGLDVRVWVRRAEAGADLRNAVAQMWPDLQTQGLDPGADPARLTVASNMEEALEGADFVQENAAEDAALKADLFARADALLPADVLIASST
ncbi:3-hydroxyacyl-CoA dehydrogenase, NAD binding domain [Tropicimonas isoalkanivorans]|uniref:3-hydroxyacyl-CoA dehydrogenase, NAD binding domain n=1 Tax=Tropicimonas isoalkanivorans TaxID=441112 RepID=A0A1I1HZN9_9RHOB|nr:3-hydroxyacyl-CoA dehydrogenase, NAD binding domain [Tropicimonas isoalkanivorans]